MVMMALSAGLDGMVWARSVVENTSIVQNFQSVVERLKYCAWVPGSPDEPGLGLTGRTIQLKIEPCIKTRPDGFTNLPPGKVDAKADAAPAGATNREMRRPSLDTLEGFFYV